ncbi:MAG: FG-GAP-like repeat-containing protein, partial [Candidatus Parcubacteria bacterium]|nr:FG-GAP-like repeat-containing protein [Candidatus Parcubacteria bacterium]
SGQNYNNVINFAITDFENDGFFVIITGTMRGYAPLVKVFNYKGEAQGEGFYAYAKTYLGGVNVAAGSTTGNGQKEIVTGAGYMGGPQVRIFDKNGKVLSGGFFAYGKDFRGGVNVACGDIDGNGIDEIVTGAGYGGSSHVRYFNSKFQPLSPGFWAFGKDSKTGARVFLNDLDGDGRKEILAASPDTFTTALTK